MLTLQRLPLISILPAHEGGKVFFQEYPAPADFGARDKSCGGALPQRGHVQLQKDGSLFEIERAHRLVQEAKHVMGSEPSPHQKTLGVLSAWKFRRFPEVFADGYLV